MTKSIVIELSEYEKIFRIIHSVSEKIDDRAGASCLFFNIIGSFIIENTLKMEAKPVVGAAIFRLNNGVMAFSEVSKNGEVSSNENSFHCWVETQDHIIDFTAPVYQKYFDSRAISINVPKKMFQRRKIDMSKTYKNFTQDGDFLYKKTKNWEINFSQACLLNLVN